MAKNDFQYGGWNSYTLQCGRWLWDDMPLNSPKRPPYWNSTSGFDFDHITAVDMSFCTSLRNFIQIGPPSAEKKTSCRFQDGGFQPSWILGIERWVLWKAQLHNFLYVVNRHRSSKLLFCKSRFLHFGDGQQTNRQTNRWTTSMH